MTDGVPLDLDVMRVLTSAPAAVVSDALDRLGRREQVLDLAIRPLWPEARLVGVAVPVINGVVGRPRSFGTKTAPFRHSFRATLSLMRTISTPWGKAAAIQQVNVAQRAGERRFATVVQLLETADGERLVRFAYTTGGSVRRGPVTLRARDVERMQKLLERTPELKEALGR